MPRPPNSPWFDLPNDIWWCVQIMNTGTRGNKNWWKKHTITSYHLIFYNCFSISLSTMQYISAVHTTSLNTTETNCCF
jgi:hypothetical protein